MVSPQGVNPATQAAVGSVVPANTPIEKAFRRGVPQGNHRIPPIKYIATQQAANKVQSRHAMPNSTAAGTAPTANISAYSIDC